ncbi:hypothetical protein DMC47_10105 [Nostoc sp. 3335mG]|nr:hypothetical protein DMC47_10105 [Nostoc sp. 3335mG]
MNSETWELALKHISNGVVVVDEHETIQLITDRTKSLFRIEKNAIRVGHTLRYFLEYVGSRIGWSPDRIATVHENHRAWKREAQARDIVHHYDDGMVLKIGYHPKRDHGAVLTYDDVTDHVRLDRLLRQRAAEAALFQEQIYSTVGTIAVATRETSARHAQITGTATATQERIDALDRAACQSAIAMQHAADAHSGIRAVFGGLVSGLDEVADRTSGALAGAQLGGRVCERLAAHAQSAGTILDLIQALAAQGRLLSFNARIEAERAGDAGRGFCVVAQAVKDLADQTVEAATRTEVDLGEIRNAIDEAIAANRQIEASIGGISRIAETVRITTTAQQEHVAAVEAEITKTAQTATIMRETVSEVDARFSDLLETLIDTSNRLAEVDQQMGTLVDGAEQLRRAHLTAEPQDRMVE